MTDTPKPASEKPQTLRERVVVSDTHTYLKRVKVPDGDVLIHCGDHTFRGTYGEVRAAFKQLDRYPHKHKLAIAGNHDLYLDEKNFPDGSVFRSWEIKRGPSVADLLAEFPGVTYLQDSEVTIDGVKFYGSPWSPWYYDWGFNFRANVIEKYGRYPQVQHDRDHARETWAKIPNDVDVLITHTPPEGILDKANDDHKLGCPELRKRLRSLSNLRLHTFGHIHESYGQVDYLGEFPLTFVNAAICNIDYDPNDLNEPIVVNI